MWSWSALVIAVSLAILVPGRAEAMRVTWSWSGTVELENSVVPVGSLYTASMSYDASTPGVYVSGEGYRYESAILAITVDAPGYHLELGTGDVNNNGTNMFFFSPAPDYTFNFGLIDVDYFSVSLPITPPRSRGPVHQTQINMFSPFGDLDIPYSSIQVTIPEPGPAVLALVCLVALSTTQALGRLRVNCSNRR